MMLRLSPFRWLLLAGAALLCFTATAAAQPTRPPNVVLILSDDQAWTDFGFMGHPRIQTPHIDKLASESRTFTRGYVPCSLCRPSLMSIITGRFPSEHGITSNDPAKGVNRREMLARVRAAQTLPKLLQPAGYVSFQAGKWWEGAYAEGGFTHGMTHGDSSRGGRHGDEGLKIGREGLTPIFEFLDGPAKARPFLLWYAPMLPHAPHNPPERLLNKYRDAAPSLPIAKYWAMCEWFDETVGELLAGLDGRGLSDNTLVIFVVDNGWIQRPNANSYAARSKRSPYDGGLRTPIMFRWPARWNAGRDEQALISSTDLAPTVLDACRVAIPENISGADLLPLLDRSGTLKRDAIFGELFSHNAADLARTEASLLSRWVIAGKWKLIVPAELSPERLQQIKAEGEVTTESGGVELFDLTADPREEHNLADKLPDEVTRLRALIEQRWSNKSSGEPGV